MAISGGSLTGFSHPQQQPPMRVRVLTSCGRPVKVLDERTNAALDGPYYRSMAPKLLLQQQHVEVDDGNDDEMMNLMI